MLTSKHNHFVYLRRGGRETQITCYIHCTSAAHCARVLLFRGPQAFTCQNKRKTTLTAHAFFNLGQKYGATSVS